MNPYETVRQFEKMIAEYAGSPYAVALDTCTIALFLCCKYLNVGEVTIPSKTYVSVPCSIIHAGGRVAFTNKAWKGTYRLEPYPIVDAACRFRKNMYEAGAYYCLSFQYRKHLPIGRGGMVLTDDIKAVEWLKLARFSGRHEVPLTEDVPVMVGWQCYMEPERAAKGMTLMLHMKDDNPDLEFEYPDLSKFSIYEAK
jgi:dTDP-4-amino-4,6-dideoxygalactose transaminase